MTDIRPQLLAMPSSLNDACRTMDLAAEQIDALVKALEQEVENWKRRNRDALAAEDMARLQTEARLRAESRLNEAIKAIEAEPCPFKEGYLADGWAEAWSTFLNRLRPPVGGASRQGERS